VTLDPAYDDNDFQTGDSLEQLLTFNPQGQIVPRHATSYTQPGPAVYVFHLRHGIKLWDGNEVTATDVGNALNYYRFPKFSLSASYQSVKSITAKDGHTVVVTLKHVDASFISVVACEGAIFEKKFQSVHRNDMGKPGVLIQGTGPYKITYYNHVAGQVGLQKEANGNWWGGAGKIHVKNVAVTMFADAASVALAYRAGDIDVAFPPVCEVVRCDLRGEARGHACACGSPPGHEREHAGLERRARAPGGRLCDQRAAADQGVRQPGHDLPRLHPTGAAVRHRAQGPATPPLRLAESPCA
jgi:ABC-type transport system substrate-binding protein